MKTQFVALTLLAAVSYGASAQDSAALHDEAAQVAQRNASSAAVAAGTATGETSNKTYTAGDRLLLDISGRVGDALEQHLAREVGADGAENRSPKALLVSSN